MVAAEISGRVQWSVGILEPCPFLRYVLPSLYYIMPKANLFAPQDTGQVGM